MTSMRAFERPGEPRLSYRIDVPKGPALGRVLLIHGYADHSARFDRVVTVWQDAGLSVARFDLRGHGHSEGPRGHVARFSDYVRDVSDLLAHLQGSTDWEGERPPAIFGHSLGGLIASHAALALGPRVSGMALTSPFFAVAKPPPAIQRALAPIVMRVAPGLKQPSGLSGSDMTHDAEIVKGYDADPLRFSHVTVGWFGQVSLAQAEVMERARMLTTPCFCIAAGDDRVVSVAAIRRFFDLIGSAEKELDVRPGLFHEVLNEPDYRDHAGRLGEHMLRWTKA
jgi:alpha-beta hydrolase superfamily lysophospholipase